MRITSFSKIILDDLFSFLIVLCRSTLNLVIPLSGPSLVSVVLSDLNCKTIEEIVETSAHLMNRSGFVLS